MSSSINVALPAIDKEFKMTPIFLSWLPTGFLLSSAIFLIPFGKLADIYGKRKIFLLGIITYTLASFFSALAFSPIFLLFIRFLHGISGAMVFSTVVALLASIFPFGERGRALGINVAATYLGLSLGPFLGGILTYHFGWRSLFLFNGFVGFLVIFLTSWKLKIKESKVKNDNFDYPGFLLYLLTFTPLMIGFSFLPRILGFLLILGAIILLFFFIRYELKIKEPILDIKLFKNNSVFTFSNLAALINYSATFGISFLLSLYFQYLRNFDVQKTGFILVAQPLTMTFFSPFAGTLSDKKEPRIIASLGMAVIAISLFLLSFLKKESDFLFIIILLIILGFGFALFSSPNTNAIMSSVENRFYGLASATLATMRIFGQMFSMGVIMTVFNLILKKIPLKEGDYLLLKSIKTIFLIFTFLCFFGIWASLKRGKMLKNKEKFI
uniref:MFS transporter n=1 Tax=candidate division WOR-3 bacterium TaxID=2052148 RepID=A0A7V5XZ66_UNCW3